MLFLPKKSLDNARLVGVAISGWLVRGDDYRHIAAAGVHAVAGNLPSVAEVDPPSVAGVAEVVAGEKFVEVFEAAYSAEAALADYWQSRTASNKLLPLPACVR